MYNGLPSESWPAKTGLAGIGEWATVLIQVAVKILNLILTYFEVLKIKNYLFACK
jgi:hypothetical protein